MGLSIPAARVLIMSAMERTDLQHPETWTMDQEDKNDVAGRCLAGLRAQGIPATRVLLDPTKLKGGYICDTMRVKIFYDTVRKMSPKATGKGARGRPETRSGLKVSLVRATPKRALLVVPAVKYEITEAYVPYLYAYICARALGSNRDGS